MELYTWLCLVVKHIAFFCLEGSKLDKLHAKDEECKVYTYVLLKLGIGINMYLCTIGVFVANETTNNNGPIKVSVPKSNAGLLTTSNIFIFIL